MSDGVDRSGLATNFWKDLIDEELEALQRDHDAGNVWGIQERIQAAQRVIRGYHVPRYALKVQEPVGTAFMRSPCPNLMALVVERGWELLGTVDTSRYVPDVEPEQSPPGFVTFDTEDAWEAQRRRADLEGMVVGV